MPPSPAAHTAHIYSSAGLRINQCHHILHAPQPIRHTAAIAGAYGIAFCIFTKFY